MKKELCLFLQDWMITACASCRSTLTLYHPEDHRVLLELEPTMEDWEVYDAQGRALGRVCKGLQGQIDARSFCLLQRDVEVQERFFYAWQAMTIGRGPHVRSRCQIHMFRRCTARSFCMRANWSSSMRTVRTGRMSTAAACIAVCCSRATSSPSAAFV